MASTTPRVKPDSRAPKQKPAHNSIKQLKDRIGTTVKLLGVAEDDLRQVDSYVYVCLEALTPKVGERPREDSREDIALVLNDAYETLRNGAMHNVQQAIQALRTEDGQ
jgi:hypothetical protein